MKSCESEAGERGVSGTSAAEAASCGAPLRTGRSPCSPGKKHEWQAMDSFPASSESA